MRFWVRWLAWVCLSLLVWTVAAESTHFHPSQSENATCTICVAAHAARPAPSSSDATPVFAAVGHLQEKDVAAEARLEFSDLDIRGPPVL